MTTLSLQSFSRLLRLVTIAAIFFSLATMRTGATTKGLSQIVTPDLQQEGELSLSFQEQSRKIGNPTEFQVELGVTKWLEIAAFKGFRPNEIIFGGEVGLIQREPYLLSAGLVNWSTQSGSLPQPFIEGGYYTEHHKFIAGTAYVNNQLEAILGYAYDFDKTWRAQLDFQSGKENSSTVGFTCNVTKDFQFNPALYISNDGPHRLFGYIVFAYTFPLWHRGK